MNINSNSNNVTFGAIKLPEYGKLPTIAKRIVNKIQDGSKFAEYSIPCDTWFFQDPAQEMAARKMLEDGNVPHVQHEDKFLPFASARINFSNIKVVIGNLFK